MVAPASLLWKSVFRNPSRSSFRRGTGERFFFGGLRSLFSEASRSAPCAEPLASIHDSAGRRCIGEQRGSVAVLYGKLPPALRATSLMEGGFWFARQPLFLLPTYSLLPTPYSLLPLAQITWNPLPRSMTSASA